MTFSTGTEENREIEKVRNRKFQNNPIRIILRKFFLFRMLRKFNKLAFSGTQSARAAANWQKEIYTTVDYDPNEPKVRFKFFFKKFF